ncbi:MAG: hypothetical protein J6W30_01515 [Bacteroidales bacterium]|nr:hypothetical protein [Bacteroidales bacterium]
MDKNSLDEKKKWKKIAEKLDLDNYQIKLILAAILITVVVLFLPEDIKTDSKWGVPLISFLTSIIAALICTASLNIYEKKRKNRYDESNTLNKTLEEINDKLAIMPTDIKQVSTEEEYDAINGFNYQFENSKKATSVLIHGRTFIRKHKKAIISRFNKDGFVSKWFFVNPNSEFLKLIKEKTGQKTDSIKEHIETNVNILIDEYRNSDRLGALEIYYMNLPPMQAVYIFDDTIIECKYYSSTVKGPCSYVVIYKNKGNKTGIGGGFVDDCIKIEMESKCVFSSYVDSDGLFMTYLKGIMDGFSITEWRNNQPDKLEFITATSNNDNSIQFSYRYYKDDADYDRNLDFCISQFKKIALQNDENSKLFFITGIGGGASCPSRINISQFGKGNVFIPKSSKRTSRIKAVYLKDFGYNHKTGAWK